MCMMASAVSGREAPAYQSQSSWNTRSWQELPSLDARTRRRYDHSLLRCLTPFSDWCLLHFAIGCFPHSRYQPSWHETGLLLRSHFSIKDSRAGSLIPWMPSACAPIDLQPPALRPSFRFVSHSRLTTARTL
ncbi:hypothetical protein CORC01_07224 [Colletotrichum orchidophilum]|uniref:Uncharacterized protein n=1 Tax=Colletotrichum orchidophilum TaxID=1209926 RepID=A0A1G4B841_9PEZI|nr:uncharacterized protein CORC01_07224 [Colletotrichum orchidophilum]OHE97442.1 hypothetical protein CORC01_07224 [Colletotrichum orchidophilum]